MRNLRPEIPRAETLLQRWNRREGIVLASLRIRDLAIIDDVEVPLAPGLNVLTGETGAGKSIIVGALDLLLGARASADAVRTGAEQAVIEGLFVDVSSHAQSSLSELELLDADEPGLVLVRRVVAANGRSRAFINGRLVNQSTLRDLTLPLVDMTSQHAQYALLDPATHLDLLDRFANTWRQREAYQAEYARYLALQEERRLLRAAERDRVDREDFLQFQLAELQAAHLEEGEEEAIAAELGRLRNATRLRTGAEAAAEALTGDRGATVAVSHAVRQLDGLLAFDPSVGEIKARLDSVRIELDDIGYELGRYASDIEDDPARLEKLEERSAALRRLLKKFGPTVTDALSRLAEVAAELARLSGADARLASLDADIAAAERCLGEQGSALSAERRQAAGALAAQVMDQLAELAMPGARFRVAFRDEVTPPRPGPFGLDRVEFEVTTNRGEVFRPLSRAASGGELSRVLLATKSVLLACDPVPTSVFDEVDTGVGGAVAEIIGRKLARAACDRQVVCITHLPQIAAFADHHLFVRKDEADGRTVTRVRVLGPDERLEEVARMLGGVTITDRTRAHALEMLKMARAQE